MQISRAGIDFIKANEGFSANFYGDVGHQAIGYGHDLKPDESITPLITQEQALYLLLEDVNPLQEWLNLHFPTLTQCQFDALCDFGYNLGLGSLQTMLAHGLSQVPVQIPYWDHVAGQVSLPLQVRRAAEVSIFLGNGYVTYA